MNTWIIIGLCVLCFIAGCYITIEVVTEVAWREVKKNKDETLNKLTTIEKHLQEVTADKERIKQWAIDEVGKIKRQYH